MTISTQTRTAGPFTGTGLIVPYPFSFKVFQASDLLLFKTDSGGTQTQLTISTDYTVVLNADQNTSPGGTVTLLVALPVGSTLSGTSGVPVTQTASLTNAGGFFPKTIEDALDRLTILMQQQGFVGIGQTLRVPEVGGVPLVAAASARANNLLGFDSNGNPIAVAPVNGSAASLAIDLANAALAAKGAGQVAYNPALAYTSGIGQVLNFMFGKTAAETAAGATIVNFGFVPGHVYRYGTNAVPGTTDMTTAMQATINQAKQPTGADALWPADTYRVTTLTLDGSGYNVRTAGGRKTVLAQATGTSTNLGQIIIAKGQNINIGDLAFTGNITTDTGEFHHCVYCFDDLAVTTAQNLHFGDLYGTNIRGDVLYVGGIAARPTTGIRFGTVSGTNVFRNLLTVAGGEVTGDALLHDGPVGYRDFDVEPNIGGTYQPSDLVLRIAKVGTAQISSDDVALINDRVEIGTLDCDFNRVAATTPVYPSAPGVNAFAIQAQNARLIKIGYFKARNYNYTPFLAGSSAIKSNVFIDVADIANCGLTEAVYNSMFADQGTGGIAYLEIGTLLCTLPATTKMVFNGNGMAVRVKRGTVTGGLLAASIPGGQYENMSIDLGGAAGIALNGCTNSYFQNVTFSNAASATLMVGGQLNTMVNVSGTFATVEGGGCADNRLVHSTINGIKYANDLLNGFVVAKAMADASQTLSALESVATVLVTSGALTAQRNLVVSAAPRIYSAFNNCTGFGVQVIGATGTGTVIGVGKRAFVQFDGVNVVRVTADI